MILVKIFRLFINTKLFESNLGLSKVVGAANRTMTSCGTAAWAAPEILKHSHYTEKADVYSFGICLWEFLSRRDPYEGMPSFQIIFAVGTEGLRPTIPDSWPRDYTQLMIDCWNQDSIYVIFTTRFLRFNIIFFFRDLLLMKFWKDCIY